MTTLAGLTPLSPTDVQRLLDTRAFADLDERLNGLQRAYEARELPEETLKQGFAAFRGYIGKRTRLLEAWVQAFPRSYAAHLSLGMHYHQRAWWYRMHDTANNVPLNAWPKVYESCETSGRFLRDAMHCTREPSLAMAKRIELNMIFSQDTWDGYVEAVERCPTSLAVRASQLRALRPEWGGSVQGMQRFLKRPEHDLLSSEDWRRLEATEFQFEGHTLVMFGEEREEGIAKFREALSVVRLPGTLMELSLALPEEAHEEALRLMEEAHALDPWDPDYYSFLGNLQIDEIRPRQILRNWRKARALGSSYGRQALIGFQKMPFLIRVAWLVIALFR